VGRSAIMIAVRDTKNREDGPVLRFDPLSLRTFSSALRVSLSSGEPGPRAEYVQSPRGGIRRGALSISGTTASRQAAATEMQPDPENQEPEPINPRTLGRWAVPSTSLHIVWIDNHIESRGCIR
jgi:hypothetical protein